MKKKLNTQLLLGAHISGAGSLHNSLKLGDNLGCTTIQIFTKNNRQWSFDLIDEKEVTLFIETQKKTAISKVISHAGYLINLASPSKDVFSHSIKALQAELLRCEQLTIPYLVLHPGARLTTPKKIAINKVADALTTILDIVPGSCMILLENMAGQGSTIGSTFEELESIRSRVTQKNRIGFCFDTCHAFAAGYALDTPKGYYDCLNELNATITFEHLKVLHLNDSVKDKGSHVDRHAWIGRGKIGLELFSLIMNDEHFVNIPKIIETPFETLADHNLNLSLLRSLVAKQ